MICSTAPYPVHAHPPLPASASNTRVTTRHPRMVTRRRGPWLQGWSQGWGWGKGSASDEAAAAIDGNDFTIPQLEPGEVNPTSIVEVEIERPTRSKRQVNAAVQIWAPTSVVYAILTDYDHLAEFIPGYEPPDHLCITWSCLTAGVHLQYEAGHYPCAPLAWIHCALRAV